MAQYKQKLTFKDFLGITFAIMFGLIIAGAVVVPIILQLELVSAAINYLERN